LRLISRTFDVVYPRPLYVTLNTLSRVVPLLTL